MTAGELVISLVLSAAGFAASVKRSQSQLDDLSDAGRQAGANVARGAAAGTSELRDMAQTAHKTGDAIAGAAEDATRELRQTARQAERTGDALEDAAEQGSGGFKEFAAVATGALAVLGGVSALQGAARHYYDMAEAVGLASDRLGMSVESLQAWQGAAVAAGGDAEELTAKMADLGDWMQDLILHDSGPLKDATADLGLSFKQANGQAVSMEEGMLRLADSMGKRDRQKATGILTQIGFDEKTIPLLLKGRKGLEDLLKVQKARAPYTKQDVENAQRQRQAQQQLDQAWEGTAAVFVRLVAPALNKVTEILATLLGWVIENKQFVLIFLGALGAVIATAVVPALAAMAAAAWAAIAPFTPLIAIIAGVALVVDDLITYIHGGESALSGLWSMFGTGEEIGARFGAIWDNVKTYLSAVWGILGGIKDFWVAIFSGDMDGVVGALGRMYDNLLSIKDVFASIFTYINEKLSVLPNWVKKRIGLGGDSPEGTAEGGTEQAAARRATPPNALGTEIFDPRPGSRGGLGPVDNSRTVTSTTNIQNVTINSQAQDAQGIAQDIAPAITNQVAQADGAWS